MIKVGITGECGSGKSYCSKIFEQLGIPVFYSDDISRQIVNTNQSLKDKITQEFGQVYGKDGKMMPSKIRDIVFVEGGESKLEKMNKIVHPYVFKEFENFCNKYKDKQYVIAESAILYEAKMRKVVDKVIYVNANEETRIKRAFERSGFSREEYKNRMKKQWPSSVKLKISDFIITNNDGDDVKKQVEEINNILNIVGQ